MSSEATRRDHAGSSGYHSDTDSQGTLGLAASLVREQIGGEADAADREPEANVGEQRVALAGRLQIAETRIVLPDASAMASIALTRWLAADKASLEGSSTCVQPGK